jgi:hypothetical protein
MLTKATEQLRPETLKGEPPTKQKNKTKQKKQKKNKAKTRPPRGAKTKQSTAKQHQQGATD